MKCNGKELEEMTPAKWDGKTREMLVWNDNDDSCVLAYVIGYTYIHSTINGFDDYKRQWICNGSRSWAHCAEIPKIDIKPKYDFIENLLKTEEPPKETVTTLKGERSEKSPSRNYTAMFDVMRRWASGEEVQYKDRSEDSEWRRVADPSWNWERYEYRVKPSEETMNMQGEGQMTNEELEQMNVIVAAYTAGDKIEYRSKKDSASNGSWHRLKCANFNFVENDYRIYVEPDYMKIGLDELAMLRRDRDTLMMNNTTSEQRALATVGYNMFQISDLITALSDLRLCLFKVETYREKLELYKAKYGDLETGTDYD